MGVVTGKTFLQFLVLGFLAVTPNDALSKAASKGIVSTSISYKKCVFQGVSKISIGDILEYQAAAGSIKKNCADFYERDITVSTKSELENAVLQRNSANDHYFYIKFFNNTNRYITRVCVFIKKSDDQNDLDGKYKYCGTSVGWVIEPFTNGAALFNEVTPATPQWAIFSVSGF